MAATPRPHPAKNVTDEGILHAPPKILGARTSFLIPRRPKQQWDLFPIDCVSSQTGRTRETGSPSEVVWRVEHLPPLISLGNCDRHAAKCGAPSGQRVPQSELSNACTHCCCGPDHTPLSSQLGQSFWGRYKSVTLPNGRTGPLRPCQDSRFMLPEHSTHCSRPIALWPHKETGTCCVLMQRTSFIDSASPRPGAKIQGPQVPSPVKANAAIRLGRSLRVSSG